MALCALLVLAAGAPAAETAAPVHLPDASVMRSASRRFVVLGGDRTSQAQVLEWAETVAERVGQLTRFPPPLVDDSPIRLVLSDAPGVEAGLSEALGRPVLRLTVAATGTPDLRAMEDALCRLLVCAYVSESRAIDPNALPAWPAVGFAENLTAERRARAGGEGYTRWREGTLPPPTVFLRGAAPETDRAMSALLIGWLVDLPESRRRFERFFKVLSSEGGLAPEELAALTVASGALGEMDSQWDEWMLRQKRMVYQPGTATTYDVEVLQAELLLYPGSFGIPRHLSDRPLRMRELLQFREAPWMSVTAFSKGQSLRLAAIGRGEAMADVAERYVAFLNALTGKAGDDKAAALLDAADKALAEFRRSVEGGENPVTSDQ
jgi:hypothetical protein